MIEKAASQAPPTERMMAKPFHRAFFLIAMMLAGTAFAAVQMPKIKLGLAKCAHYLPMSLTPGLAEGIEIEATGFNTGNDVPTALVSESIDVAQVTYLTALDKGFGVAAISGQIKGGSECQKHRCMIVFATHSVDEALVLGNKIVVTTRRPGRIRESVTFDFPQPRDITTPESNDAKRSVLALIREQSTRSALS
jgi:hypothetical protein